MRAYELRTSNIELVIELDSGLPEVMVDAQQLQEVFLNLIMNAEQAMVEAKRSGKLVIRSEKVEEGVRVVVSVEGARDNRRAASGNDSFSSVTSFTASWRNSRVYLPCGIPFMLTPPSVYST